MKLKKIKILVATSFLGAAILPITSLNNTQIENLNSNTFGITDFSLYGKRKYDINYIVDEKWINSNHDDTYTGPSESPNGPVIKEIFKWTDYAKTWDEFKKINPKIYTEEASADYTIKGSSGESYDNNHTTASTIYGKDIQKFESIKGSARQEFEKELIKNPNKIYYQFLPPKLKQYEFEKHYLPWYLSYHHRNSSVFYNYVRADVFTQIAVISSWSILVKDGDWIKMVTIFNLYGLNVPFIIGAHNSWTTLLIPKIVIEFEK